MDGADWLAIVNPVSGRSRHRDAWPAIERPLREAGIRLDVVETTVPHQGHEIARQAVLDGRRRVLVAGGDGSAHDVINGIMNAGVDRAREVTLAVAPLGTGNDWARTLGISRDPASIVAALTGGRVVPHDVGAIDFPSQPDTPRRWFINVAGAGYDAFVLSRLPTQVPSKLAYLRGVVSGIVRFRPPRFHVSAGDRSLDEKLLVVFAANGRYCGNGMYVAPAARIDDGRIDVLAIRELNLATLLRKLPKLYDGTLPNDPVVRSFRSEELFIDAAPACAIEADGQLVGETPVRISVMRDAVSVVSTREQALAGVDIRRT